MNFQDIHRRSPPRSRRQRGRPTSLQDPYLSKHRGEYAERGAVFLPLLHAWISASRRMSSRISGGERHRFQFRIDMINFGNMLNNNWGVSQRLVSNSAARVNRRAAGRCAGPRSTGMRVDQQPVDDQEL